jgi:NitT/TauT family transport system substrate-binding protein
MSIRRLDVLRAGIAGAAASFVLPSFAGAQSFTLRVASIPIDPTAEPYYAQAMGFFKQAGLDVTITSFTNGAAASSALVGGAVDISITDAVSMAAAHARGVPISYIAPATITTPTHPAYAVIVRTDSPIRTAADFSGKTVAVNGLKNIVHIPLEAWIDNNGGNSSSVKFVELPYPAVTAALEDGKIDAASVSEPFITGPVSTGKFRMISLTQNGIAPVFAFSGWSATNDFSAKHPGLTKKFAAVMAQTARWANENRPKSGAILVDISKMPAALAGKIIRAEYGIKLEAPLFQPVIDAAAKYDVIPKAFPAREIFNPLVAG